LAVVAGWEDVLGVEKSACDGDIEMAFHLAQRTDGNTKEPGELAVGASACALGDVCWNRRRRSAQLARKPQSSDLGSSFASS